MMVMAVGQEFEKEPETFEYIQYTGANADEVSAWLADWDYSWVMVSYSGDVIFDPGTPQSRPPMGIREGQYIVIRLRDNRSSILDNVDHLVPVGS